MEKKRISALLFAFCGFLVHTGVLGTIGQGISPDNSLVGYDGIHYEYIPEIFADDDEDTCDCGEYGTCSFDENGKQKCDCDKGYSSNKENKCAACDCGDKGTCSFDDTDKKKCVCKKGFSVNKDNICAACDCGDKGTCSFDDTDKKKCVCEKGFSVNKDNICAACDCGDKGTCSFDDTDRKNCDCEKGFSVNKDNICAACDCGDKGTCSFDDTDKKKCVCEKGFSVNKDNICAACKCGEHQTCTFDESGNPKCDCDRGYSFNKDNICAACDCGEYGSCSFDENGKQKCDCNKGYSTNKENKCAECDCGDYGKCKFDENGNIKCECQEGYISNRNKKCIEKCQDAVCENGGSCTNGLCTCKNGVSGDRCEVIGECITKFKECKGEGETCRYNVTKEEAFCDCGEEKEYDVAYSKCIAKWCTENKELCDVKKCDYDRDLKTGYCKCDSETQFFDYSTKTCKNPEPCDLILCNENEKCVKVGQKGECVCDDGYEKSNDTCVRANACKSDTCFSGAKCEETDIPGEVKCFCEKENFVFDGTQCIDGNCFLEKKFGKVCKLSCPPGMRKNKDSGDCEPNEGSEKCGKDCGYGWCVKKDKEEKCICIPTYSKPKNDKCVLAEKVCASKNLTEDSMRCYCNGQFKYSENKITCEKKSCSDEEVKNICKEKGAEKCKNTWKSSESSYECKCKSGYEDENDICTDVCSLVETKETCGQKGQFCYISGSKTGKCSCPPLFTMKGATCKYLASSSHMLKQLPIISKKYLNSKTDVDYVQLSVDIFKTMKAMYPYLEYSSVSKYKLDGDVIKTDVLLQFTKETKSAEIGRIKIQKLNTNCSDAEDGVLFPPSLCLRNGSIGDVKSDVLDVCNAKDSLCGPYAECEDNKCRCTKGFRISEYGAKRGKLYEIVRCEDIDECKDDLHSCSANTTCVNTPGDFYCKCKPGYKKKSENVPYENKPNKDDCVDLCIPNPCGDNGVCRLKDNKMFDCSCKTGYEGTLCDRNDVAYANAKKGTAVVGAVLGVILAICLIAFFLYVRRVRKNSDSEDFSPVPTRQDNAEMTERRPIRGVTNRGYQ